MQRWRITYSKLPEIMYTSNLDLHKIWERSLRRANLPVAYSQGFHPQPKMQQASPLPLGMTSSVEMIDVWLNQDTTSDDIDCALQPALPAGMQISMVEQVALELPALQTQIFASEYVIKFIDEVSPDELEQRLDALLHRDQIMRERRGKVYDLRQLILKAQFAHEPSLQLNLWLMAMEGKTGRADEVLSALGIDPYSTLIHRQALLTREQFDTL
jgi:radical SAM-linked protein